jgi:hypothetical protein
VGSGVGVGGAGVNVGTTTVGDAGAATIAGGKAGISVGALTGGGVWVGVGDGSGSPHALKSSVATASVARIARGAKNVPV